MAVKARTHDPRINLPNRHHRCSRTRCPQWVCSRPPNGRRRTTLRGVPRCTDGPFVHFHSVPDLCSPTDGPPSVILSRPRPCGCPWYLGNREVSDNQNKTTWRAAIPRIAFIPVYSLPLASGRIAFHAIQPTLSHREPIHSVLVRVLLIVLPEQILPIIVSVRRPDHSMDVLAGRLTTFQIR